jgi:hypothetical protein
MRIPGLISLAPVVNSLSKCNRKLNRHADHRGGHDYTIGEISGSHGGEYEDDCFLGCCAL